jgi:cyclic beta-1,2-glucan synthetase
MANRSVPLPIPNVRLIRCRKAGRSSPARAAGTVRTALDAVAHRLVRREAKKLIQLFDPPFDKSAMEPGYIKGYVPGVRENGGQYTHAAIWTVMAFSLAGETARAWELFQAHQSHFALAGSPGPWRVTRPSHTSSRRMFTAFPPHTGRGGWTWYTGSAGWMYRLILETLLGVEVAVDELRFTPRVPLEWKTFRLDYRHRQKRLSHHLHQCVGQLETPRANPA